MKKLAAFLGILITVPFIYAAIEGTPFIPEVDDRFNNIETLSDTQGIDLASGNIIVGDANGNANSVTMSGDATMSNAGALSLQSQTADSTFAKRVARVTYDVAVDGGGIGAADLGVDLPANALIQRSWFYVVTQFTDGGSGTVALHCEDANNIFTAADITGNADGSFVSGNQTGEASTMTGAIASACDVTATVATATQTAGKLIVFIEYVVGE